MGGEIIKTGANIIKQADTIVVNATNGDVTLSSAKSIVQSSDSTINHGSYRQPEGSELKELLVKEVIGPDKVEIGKTYTYVAKKFSRKPIGGELQAVKWAYKVDDGPLQYFANPGIVIGSIVKKNITITGALFDDEKLTVYAYLQSPIVNVESEIDAIDLPFVMDRFRAAGERAAGVMANDMGYGDGVDMTTNAVYTRAQIKSVGWLMSADIDVSASSHWSRMSSMVTSLFSVGELQGVAVKMIAKFKSNSGGEFTDSVLTRKVEEHDSTKNFVTNVTKVIVDTAKREGGNITSLKDETFYWKKTRTYSRPHFSTLKDTFAGGLTICINDVWAYEISIIEYEVNDTEFSGKFKVTLFDQFGLDKPDVDKKYGYLAGFRSWFLLQHRRDFKPFITKIEFERTFEGTF